MSNSILDNYYSSIHASAIHAHGVQSTKILLELAAIEPEQKVLEIGFGTGGSLTTMASLNSETAFYGCDQSPKMLDVAKKRLAFCGQKKRVQLVLMDEKDRLPFSDEFFDTVWIESVLAIQQGKALPTMLNEIYRVLKPDGHLVFNETLWLSEIERNTIAQINADNINTYGIIQANEVYANKHDWEGLLKSIGFKVEQFSNLDELIINKSLPSSNPTPFRSELFTLIGKIKRQLSPKLSSIKKRLESPDHTTNGHQKLMVGYVVKAQKTTN